MVTKLAAKSTQTLANNDAASRNVIQELKNTHEKELQIVVGKTKAVLRSNFRKQILEFEKEYDARIAQMRTNLRGELNKKHDDEIRRLKDRHLKDIKMMKMEIKKAAAKEDGSDKVLYSRKSFQIYFLLDTLSRILRDQLESILSDLVGVN